MHDNNDVKLTKKLTAIEWKRLLKGGNAIGPQNAPVQIVEFADFECPFCGQLFQNLDRYQKNNPQNIRIIFYNFPLPSHLEAKSAAVAVQCAAKFDLFKKYYHLLFNNQKILDTEPWDSLAKLSKIPNIKQFNTCLRDTTIINQIQKEYKLGQSLGVAGIPTMFINGYRVVGYRNYQDLTDLIKNAIKKTYVK